ncbi:MAG: prephenate dehydrogenase/arogenate dehydrogenase family protein [Bryobacterales bacterium]|nr:prephenate dehydrogenase/arogenate dehydrogenase family protein [Bryobacterales bacterium]
MRTVVVAGTGLIGASFGLALKKAGFDGRIIGVSSEAALRDAREAGAIDESAPLAEAVSRADLLFLAQPIGRIVNTLRTLDARDVLITDAGSTKVEIARTAAQYVRHAQFLGGHPMAGKEKRGAGAADADLFRGRTWVLTPIADGDMETPAAKTFVGWLERIGAVPVVLTPEEHDRLVSFTSHLAQLASTALASTVAEHLNVPEHWRVAGPGLVDTTRLAMSAYEIWRDIFATNSGNIDQALAAYIQKLEHLRENLRGGQMREEFETAAAFAAKLRR